MHNHVLPLCPACENGCRVIRLTIMLH